jgi:glycogen debranching enzyme
MAFRTLVDGFTFFVTAGTAELGPSGGLYHRDTRHLSALDVDVENAELLALSETASGSNGRIVTLASDGSAVNRMNGHGVPKHTETVLTRRQAVHEGIGYTEVATLVNHAATPLRTELTVEFGCDFQDLFETRGLATDIDRVIDADVGSHSVVTRYLYENADGTTTDLATAVRFDREPATLTDERAVFEVDIGPQGAFTLPFVVGLGDERRSVADIESRTPPVAFPTVTTDDPRYDAVFRQSAADLTALTTETEHGPVPLAGTPWFVTAFGRDALLTAHQTLAVAPELAAGTLRYLAAHQGRRDDPDREEEPGKILHEMRHGELAGRERVPHTPYYGTIDATPLWVFLLARTRDRRGETGLVASLGRELYRALEWIHRKSALEGDDPLLYDDGTAGVLSHKAWKDTAGSIRFADGEVASGPLAVAEVQGYAAKALRCGARLLDGIDAPDEASPSAYRGQAARIERAFDEEFWLPERSYYGVARAADGRIVDAVTSNVGHCLWTDTIPAGRVSDVVQTLVDGPLDAGWGLRTMSPGATGYSPVSYHTGGVWPHDTSIVALGLANHGYGAEAERLGRDVLEAATYFPDSRLPELYCGFDADREPVEYPAACTPQAWGAGAPFAFLEAALELDFEDGTVRTNRSSALVGGRTVESVREALATCD